ncbi:hypothetical protein, partial [Paraburkholderia piptadeniae]|uniref:hypothetical protein n=1 Tax=Paraburkholderia piptadeniae TaxID=1701573 RepID=UPI001C43F49D
ASGLVHRPSPDIHPRLCPDVQTSAPHLDNGPLRANHVGHVNELLPVARLDVIPCSNVHYEEALAGVSLGYFT